MTPVFQPFARRREENSNPALPAIILVAALGSGCGGSGGSSSDGDAQAKPGYADAVLLGGATTDLTASSSSHGFSAPAANLTDAQRAHHLDGDVNFETQFSNNGDFPEVDGLGPVLNNTNCNACHQRDGRGTPPPPTETFSKLAANESLFLRISVEDDATPECTDRADLNHANGYCAPRAVTGFSTQLFHRGIGALRPDGGPTYTGQADVHYRYETSTVTYGDGSTVDLRKPVFMVLSPYDAPAESAEVPVVSSVNTSQLLQPGVRFGARIGMPVFGLGLLEAIGEQDILALADPMDADGDGISGRANWVLDAVKAQAGDTDPVSLGRFGWKANTPSVRVQSLGALRGDMGITNPLFSDESIAGTELYTNPLYYDGVKSGVDYSGAELDPTSGLAVEAGTEFSEAVVFYSQTLHVPARRNVEDPAVQRGARLFSETGCAACHRPKFTTGQHPEGIAELSNQEIYPFTDMLLHDMGEGLADGRRDFLASGREWKTRPLWGIGLTKTVNPGAGFLHDGRARTLEEAILWHGGEAEAGKERFRTMAKADRDALVAFLMSL